MDLIQLSSFLLFSILMTLAPGPDILYVIAQSVHFGKWFGILTAAGLVTGLLLHIIMVAWGVSALLKESAVTFQVIRYLGSAYLLFLGYKSLQEKEIFLEKNLKQQKFFSLYRQGFYMSVLNPKLMVFFLAFFPQFIVPNTEKQTLQIFVLGTIFIVQGFIVFILVSIFVDFFAKQFRSSQFFKHMRYIKAGLLFVLALGLFFF